MKINRSIIIVLAGVAMMVSACGRDDDTGLIPPFDDLSLEFEEMQPGPELTGVCCLATGDQTFERYFRVQQNSMEQLILFLPAIALFGLYVSQPIGAGLGLVFILGRALYARAYYRNPEDRGLGFGLSVLSNLVLTFGGLIGALVAYIQGS